jgi:pilus assembly protein CpaB
VAAAVSLQPGTTIKAEDLTEISWPESVPLNGWIEKKEDVLGHVLNYALQEKEPVLQRNLAANASFGLSAKIPDGMRAIAVKTNEVMNLAGFIFPGSHVDVLVTLRANNAAATTTRTVLQNVQVLSAGSKMDPDPNGKPENVSVVTLLVTPEQSERLELAENQGTLHFVLRNSGDSDTRDTAPVDMGQLAGIVKTAATPKLVQPKPVEAKPIEALELPAIYRVETIAGGKVTVDKFPDKGPEKAE